MASLYKNEISLRDDKKSADCKQTPTRGTGFGINFATKVVVQKALHTIEGCESRDKQKPFR